MGNIKEILTWNEEELAFDSIIEQIIEDKTLSMEEEAPKEPKLRP